MTNHISELSAYYTASLGKELPVLEQRKRQLRVSGFPFCGLRHAYNLMEGIVEKTSNFGSSYYTSVGTAAHTALQRWMGAQGKVYGNWKCLRCKHFVRFSCKNVCPKCSHEMEYEEFTVEIYKHVSGHTDGLFRDSQKDFWVIDYKTSSVKAIKSQKYEPTFPYSGNKHQIRAYVPLLEKELSIKIAGWMLLYAARDNPLIHKVVGARMSKVAKANVLQSIKLYDDQYEVAQNLDSLAKLKYLRDTKFCKSVEHYNKQMKGYSGCPLAAVCFGSLLNQTLRLSFEHYIGL